MPQGCVFTQDKQIYKTGSVSTESMCRYICTYQVACKCSKQRAYRSVGRYVWKGYREQPGNRRGCIKQLKFESCTTIWCEDCIPAAITADHEKAVVRERDRETERQRGQSSHVMLHTGKLPCDSLSRTITRQLSTHTDTQWIHYKSPVRSWHANCVYALGNYVSPNEIHQNEMFVCRLRD